LTFDTHDHVVLLAQLEACSFPSTEMVTGVDSATAMHLGSDGPVLLEVGVVAEDGRRVGTLLLPDFVCCAVAVVRAKVVCASVVGGVVFTHCRWKMRLGMHQSRKDPGFHLLDSIT
jgi:hypothetical protein